MVILMKNYIIILFIFLISCQSKKYNGIKDESTKVFNRANLVYPKDFHETSKKSPIEYLKKLNIPLYLHSDKEIILLTCSLVKDVNTETYLIHGQTYPLDVNIDVVKIIKNSCQGEIHQPSTDLIFLKDLANAASEIQKRIK